MRVVVVGAGLTAAGRLLASGVEVVMLEAGDRLGGRVRTVRSFRDGQHVESGEAAAEAILGGR
jgi:uncharacterized protein with NAD-binding domain and iron-sulfur cluster